MTLNLTRDTALLPDRYHRLHLPRRLSREGLQSMGLFKRVRVRVYHPTYQQGSW